MTIEELLDKMLAEWAVFRLKGDYTRFTSYLTVRQQILSRFQEFESELSKRDKYCDKLLDESFGYLNERNATNQKCRELETDNKRLKDRIEKAHDTMYDMMRTESSEACLNIYDRYMEATCEK